MRESSQLQEMEVTQPGPHCYKISIKLVKLPNNFNEKFKIIVLISYKYSVYLHKL